MFFPWPAIEKSGLFSYFAIAKRAAIRYDISVKTFILLSAIPGSGKSTWAKRYIEEHPNAKVVSSDELRVEFGGRANNFDHEKEVWDTFLERIHLYGQEDDATVIADATMISNKFRKYYYENTPEFERHILVFFDIPYEVCAFQNKMREDARVVPDHALKRMSEDFEKPSDEVMSLYDEVITVTQKFVSSEYKNRFN